MLVIDSFAKAQAQKVVDYASKPGNWFLMDADGIPKSDPPGNNPRLTLRLNTYRCVFSYTRLETKLWRHLSISIPEAGMYASPHAAYEIAQLFGFTGWDGTSISLPKGWMVDSNSVDNCIVLMQEIP